MKPGLLPGEGQGGDGGMTWSSHSHLPIPHSRWGWAADRVGVPGSPRPARVGSTWASWHKISTIKIIISFRHLHDT